jgi:hypothetical protein
VTDIARDVAIQEAAAAICPANHRHNGNSAEPPCGDCYAAAESAIAAYVEHLTGHQPAAQEEP